MLIFSWAGFVGDKLNAAETVGLLVQSLCKNSLFKTNIANYWGGFLKNGVFW